jgi:uncharacterized membrane protein (UPF0136 family)
VENIARIVMVVYGALMFVGGIGGFVIGHSNKSLMAGFTSAVLMGVAYYLSRQQPKVGFGIGAAVAAGLIVVFVIRIQELLAKTPPGSIGMNAGLCALSGATALFLLIALIQVRA